MSSSDSRELWQCSTEPGAHIAAPGPYQEAVATLIRERKYPNLKYPDSEYDKFYRTCPRSAAVRFREGRNPTFTDFQSFSDLQAHLSSIESELSNSTTPFRELILLEGLRPDFVAALGHALQVDPNVFVRHQ